MNSTKGSRYMMVRGRNLGSVMCLCMALGCPVVALADGVSKGTGDPAHDDTFADLAGNELEATGAAADVGAGPDGLNPTALGGGSPSHAFGAVGNNAAELRQRGGGNFAEIRQAGYGNDVSLSQVGDANRAALSQAGYANQLNLSQVGKGLAIRVGQDGVGQTISIRQAQ